MGNEDIFSLAHSRKKQTGGGRLINNKKENPDVIKKKSCEISRSLGFRPQKFTRGVITTFLEFLGVKNFIWNFQR